MERRDTYRFPFSRYPAVRIVLLMIAGILAHNFYSPSLLLSILMLSALLVVFLAIEWLNRNLVSTFFSELSVIFFLLVIAAFGLFRMSVQSQKSSSITEQLIQISDWEEVTVMGSIRSISVTSAGKERWDLRVDSLYFGDLVSEETFRARILADEAPGRVTLGDRVHLRGTIIPVSGKRNPMISITKPTCSLRVFLHRLSLTSFIK